MSFIQYFSCPKCGVSIRVKTENERCDKCRQIATVKDLDAATVQEFIPPIPKWERGLPLYRLATDMLWLAHFYKDWKTPLQGPDIAINIHAFVGKILSKYDIARIEKKIDNINYHFDQRISKLEGLRIQASR